MPSVQQVLQSLAEDLYSRFCDVYGWRRNCIISPIAIYESLILLLPGAATETLTEITCFLDLPQDLKGRYLHTEINSLFPDHVKHFTGVSYLLASENCDLRKSFKRCLHSHIKRIQTKETIENSRSINSKIIMDTGERALAVSPSQISFGLGNLSLLSAAHLTISLQRFAPSLKTEVGEFFVFNKSAVRINLLRGRIPLLYADFPQINCSATRIPLKRHEMLVLLPKKPLGLPKTLFMMFTSGQNHCFRQLFNRKLYTTTMVYLGLPICTVNNGLSSLKDILSEMGFQRIFDPEKADFSKALKQSNICVTSVLHKAVIEIKDVKGGDGHAVATEEVLNAVPFIANHPFMYIILTKSGLPLFIGHLSQPVASKPRSTQIMKHDEDVKPWLPYDE